MSYKVKKNSLTSPKIYQIGKFNYFCIHMKEKFLKGILKGLALFPLGILYLFSDVVSFVLYHVIKYRRKVVRKNLTDSFPAKTLKEIIAIEKDFYRYLGDQIVETLKILHISDKELSKRITVSGYELINQSIEANKSSVVLMGHYGNWEWVQEISRYFLPSASMISIYHPLNDKMWNQFFIEMRSRWGANIIPMKKAPRVLLNKNSQPWVCGFIADAYTWHKNEDNWVEFLNHKTWFIYGPEEIGNKVEADFFYLDISRPKRGYYDMKLSRLQPADTQESFPYMREFWKEFEQTILRQPAYWLWSHKRWK